MDDQHRLLPVMPGLAWTELRAAAVDYAGHGWPVLPGTYQLAEHAGWLGKPGAVGLEPVADLWQVATTTNRGRAMDWWTRRPYSLLLACGTAVSAIEMPAARGKRVLETVSAGPVAVSPFGRWLFFVSGNASIDPKTTRDSLVRWHTSGSWVPLPPTSVHGVSYRWRVSPADVEWRSPSAADLQQALIDSQ